MPKGFEWTMKKRILIVDDDISIRSSLQKILSDSGYEVSSAQDGDAARDEFRTADLLILDLNLPIQDGWDVLGHVNAGYPLLPVIVITGLADQLDEQTIPGASAFLEKPIEVSALLRTIGRLLSVPPEKRSRGDAAVWQLPSTRSNSAERRTKAGAHGLKRFKSA
jgi:two-component system, response regulator, stage 0 sporulation protein F